MRKHLSVPRRVIGTAATLLLALSPAHAQQHDTTAAPGSPASRTPGGFHYDEFHARELVADWMAGYDQCAWVTSDSLVAQATPPEQHRLGSEWFCYRVDGKWNAIYGRYDAATDTYDAVVHYAELGNGHFGRSDAAAPSDALPIARALAATVARLPKEAVAARIRFNAFARETAEGPEVWLLPAWQPNGLLVWGMEFRYAYDAAGRTVRDSTVVVTPLRAARPDTTQGLRIDSASPDVPTVGEIFFILRYHHLFRSLRVYTPRFVTTLFDQDGKRAWLTAVRDTTR